MVRLLRFGSGVQQYDFPQSTQLSFRTNFGNVVPQITKLPGTHGGYDQLRGSPAPSEVGTIQASWVLVPPSDGNKSISDLTDEVYRIADWGEKRLFIKPFDNSAIERWCNCRINSIDISENAGDNAPYYLVVKGTWQAADPFWINQGTESWSWGDGTLWGGAPWGGAPLVINATNLQTTVNVAVGGTMTTFARLVITAPIGYSSDNFTLRRTVEGIVRDEIIWNTPITSSDTLKINPRNNTVFINGSDGFNNNFLFKHPDWLRLAPGVNKLSVLLPSTESRLTLLAYWYERFR